jgi:hypothetical protein
MKRPHALHTGRPSWVLRQREVLFVEQFEQEIGSRFSLSVLETLDSLRVDCGFGSLEGKVGVGSELNVGAESPSSDGENGVGGELGLNMSLLCEMSVKSPLDVEFEVEHWSGCICCSWYGFVKVGSGAEGEVRYARPWYSPELSQL